MKLVLGGEVGYIRVKELIGEKQHNDIISDFIDNLFKLKLRLSEFESQQFGKVIRMYSLDLTNRMNLHASLQLIIDSKDVEDANHFNTIIHKATIQIGKQFNKRNSVLEAKLSQFIKKSDPSNPQSDPFQTEIQEQISKGNQ